MNPDWDKKNQNGNKKTWQEKLNSSDTQNWDEIKNKIAESVTLDPDSPSNKTI